MLSDELSITIPQREVYCVSIDTRTPHRKRIVVAEDTIAIQRCYLGHTIEDRIGEYDVECGRKPSDIAFTTLSAASEYCELYPDADDEEPASFEHVDIHHVDQSQFCV